MSDAGADAEELPAGMGARLRHERELRQLTEQQVAEHLNLDPAVIRALEADDYHILGAAVFAKGHLRRYGAMLGIPDDELVDAFEQSRSQLPQPTLVPKAREEMLPVRARPRWPWVVGSLAVFLVAAAIVTYLTEYGFGLPGDDAAPAQPAAGESGPPPAAGPTSVSAEPPASAVVAPEAGTQGVPAATLGPGEVAVELSFAADSWVEVYDGSGRAVLYDLGLAGTTRTVTAAAPLGVTLGNAPAVTLRVNGRAVALPVLPAGQTVARFSIGPDGSLH